MVTICFLLEVFKKLLIIAQQSHLTLVNVFLGTGIRFFFIHFLGQLDVVRFSFAESIIQSQF